MFSTDVFTQLAYKYLWLSIALEALESKSAGFAAGFGIQRSEVFGVKVW